AIGCLMALNERGVRVPQEMAVAGFDDIPVARLIRPALTTVRINIAELSRRAFKRLVAVIDGDNSENVPETVHPLLVVRESSVSQTAAAKTALEKRNGKRSR
ncbi:MAG TPA: substrate-binding domain-containing protein, partial [Phenylobacterium sp.]|nr:substrate-binding domain-containing protein [Phenylobacterium sp.]